MASVMAIESEVFGSCVGGIDVSVGMENRGSLLCCAWDYLGFFLGRLSYFKNLSRNSIYLLVPAPQ